jgi:hypothetical protein
MVSMIPCWVQEHPRPGHWLWVPPYPIGNNTPLLNVLRNTQLFWACHSTLPCVQGNEDFWCCRRTRILTHILGTDWRLSSKTFWKTTLMPSASWYNAWNPTHLGHFSTLCGLVVRVPGYRSWGPGLDSRRYQIFWEVVGLERGPLSLVRIIEELLEWKSSGSGLGNRN